MIRLRYLLDTSALLAHSRQEPGWVRVQALFQEDDSEVLAASVSLTEFARRLRELGATIEEARRTVESYREVLDEIVPVDARVLRRKPLVMGERSVRPGAPSSTSMTATG
jgi:PIN domain nuclease of toxin-antitoxin system